MTQTEFKRRILLDMRDVKMRKLHREGHTDEEISLCCGVNKNTVQNWRKSNGLIVNTVYCAKGYKWLTDSRKMLGREVNKSRN